MREPLHYVQHVQSRAIFVVYESTMHPTVLTLQDAVIGEGTVFRPRTGAPRFDAERCVVESATYRRIAEADGKPARDWNLPQKPVDSELQPGDVVVLKSGGFKMTVTRVFDVDVHLVWHDEAGKLRGDDLPTHCLMRAPSDA